MHEQMQQQAHVTGHVEALKTQLIKMVLTHDDHLFQLCEKYFDLADLIAIGKRMIGTGMVGGKSVGMLLARNILARESANVKDRLEIHDSFFIGSDVFYSYVIQNDCWWKRHHIKTADNIFEKAAHLQQKLNAGSFSAGYYRTIQRNAEIFRPIPDYRPFQQFVGRRLRQLVFRGNMKACFAANQGTPEQRSTVSSRPCARCTPAP